MGTGISDIGIFAPDRSIHLETLAQRRIQEDSHWETRLPRALGTTGQKNMRFPRVWEDPITLAAEAALKVLTQSSDLDPQDLRMVVMGTETAVDMSKPGSNYVLGLLQKRGLPIGPRLTSFQVQHACAGGSLGLLTAAGFLAQGGRGREAALILTSDVARYTAPSTAEITQGAGATALLVERSPKLLDLDLETAGFYSQDVDDFFRPLGSTTAKVKGSFSQQCYHESFLAAFEDHCRRAGVSPREELESIDLWALHVPYALMPVTAMLALLKTHLGLEEPQAREWMEQKRFFDSLVPAAQIGNIYTGSLWLSLAWSLEGLERRTTGSLEGKKVLMASYGSGNTMAVFTGTLKDSARPIIRRWHLQTLLDQKTEASYEEYLSWLETPKDGEGLNPLLSQVSVPAGRFYLKSIREDGYREYAC